MKMMKLKIKRAYEAGDESDGARILVDRLWPRGLSKERAALTLWLKEVAPSPDLRTWFGHDPEKFQEFCKRYRIELAANAAALEPIASLLSQGPVTLVYAAHDEVHNHAIVLAEYLRDVLTKDKKRRSKSRG